MEAQARKKEKGDLLWFKIALAVLPWISLAYMKLVDWTCRKIYLNREYEDQCREKGSFTIAGFHGPCIYLAYYAARYETLIMASRSWDGDVIAACVERWGNRTCRGSSSRGGKEALAEMIDQVKEKNCVTGLAVDAPRGPARKVKMGTVILSRETGQPVLPWGFWTTRCIQFNSWDKMILPLPFGTIVMAFGKPTVVPKGLDHDEYERIRQQIEDELVATQDAAEAKVRQLKAPSNESALKPVPKETTSKTH
jgi:lysophospholipid acyltransferase (LPLAT)-like uncharacterized protein